MTEHATVPATGGEVRGSADEAEAAWATAAAAVLRKSGRLAADAPDSDVWNRLARSTVEGLTVPPLGTPSRASQLATAGAPVADPGQAPYLRGSAPGGGWDVRALISDPDPVRATATATANLQGGAQSLWITLGAGGTDPADLAHLLDGVYLEMAPVVLDGGRVSGDVVLAAAHALAEAGALGGGLHPGSSIGADPVGRRLRTAGDDASDDKLVEIASMAADLGIGAIVVDGSAVHEAGAGDAGEIGYSLAAGAWYLRALTASGVDIDTACGLIGFRYAVTDEQFPSIAKLRAARLVWHRVAELSGASPDARRQRQHAVTSAAMLTRYDPWVNMLRGTVAAFAAGVGGAEAITVLPFDSALGIPEEFGHRMARNVSALLLGESHVGAVADPAGGSYAVEMLTDELAHAAWAAFGEIETAGGVLAAAADGSLAAAVARTRSERDRRIARRRQPITGISEFPNTGESAATLPQRRPVQGGPVRQWARSWAGPFEDLRDAPPERPVVLVTVGSAVSASARELFIRNVLAAGGIDVRDDGEPDGDQKKGSVVVLAGSDAAYAEELAGAASAAKNAGARAVFLAGRPRDVLASLPDGLIDGTIAAGDDVLEFLHTVRRVLESAR